MTPAPVVLAIDGGGSKTDVLAIGLDGEVVARARGRGGNPQVNGWPSGPSWTASGPRSSGRSAIGRC